MLVAVKQSQSGNPVQLFERDLNGEPLGYLYPFEYIGRDFEAQETEDGQYMIYLPESDRWIKVYSFDFREVYQPE